MNCLIAGVRGLSKLGELFGPLDVVRYKQAAAPAIIGRSAQRRGESAAAAQSNPALLESARQLRVVT
jgi:hypothetical protein